DSRARRRARIGRGDGRADGLGCVRLFKACLFASRGLGSGTRLCVARPRGYCFTNRDARCWLDFLSGRWFVVIRASLAGARLANVAGGVAEPVRGVFVQIPDRNLFSISGASWFVERPTRDFGFWAIAHDPVRCLCCLLPGIADRARAIRTRIRIAESTDCSSLAHLFYGPARFLDSVWACAADMGARRQRFMEEGDRALWRRRDYADFSGHFTRGLRLLEARELFISLPGSARDAGTHRDPAANRASVIFDSGHGHGWLFGGWTWLDGERVED